MVSYEHFSEAEAAAFTFTACKICTNASIIARSSASPTEEKSTGNAAARGRLRTGVEPTGRAILHEYPWACQRT